MERSDMSMNGNGADAASRPGAEVEIAKLLSKKRQPKAIPLDILVKSAEPLLARWMMHDKEKHRVEIDFKTKVMHAEMARAKHVTWVALVVGLAVFGLVAYLVGKGRDELGIQLITLVAGIFSAAFGGYGYAVSRKKAERDESDL